MFHGEHDQVDKPHAHRSIKLSSPVIVCKDSLTWDMLKDFPLPAWVNPRHTAKMCASPISTDQSGPEYHSSVSINISESISNLHNPVC